MTEYNAINDKDLIINNANYIAARIYAAVIRYFAFEDDVGLETFENEFSSYMETITNKMSRKEFYFSTIKLLACLNNSHTKFFDGAMYGCVIIENPEIEYIENKWLFVCDNENYKVGDEIILVDNTPVFDWYKYASQYISESKLSYKKHSIFRMLPLLKEIKNITVKKENGDIECHPYKMGVHKSLPRYETKLFNNNVLYINIKSFEDAELSEKVIEDIKRVSPGKIIFDVRGNGGGSTPVKLIEYLMEKPYRDWTFKTPISIGLSAANATMKIFFEKQNSNGSLLGVLDGASMFGAHCSLYAASSTQLPKSDIYKEKIVVLIDEHTFSAAEDFVLPFKQTGRAVLIGATTNGSTGESYIADFGDGMLASISTKRILFPSGEKFEGVGIEPDIFIRPSISDRLKGYDPALAAALDSELCVNT